MEQVVEPQPIDAVTNQFKKLYEQRKKWLLGAGLTDEQATKILKLYFKLE